MTIYIIHCWFFQGLTPIKVTPTTYARKRLFTKISFVQLNEYETEPYFLQIFQNNTTVCLIIHMLCKSCETEIALNSNQNRSAQY